MRERLKGRKARCGIALSLVLSLVLAACSAEGQEGKGAASDGKISIVTTIAQIAEPLSIIGGDKVSVSSLMGPGVDPHLYNATQGDIKKMASADIVFYSGLHLEGNMTEVFEQIGKTKPVKAIAEAIPEDLRLKDEKGDTDPHVWFDIDLWGTALGSATEGLKEHFPEHAELFEANKNDYLKKLDELKTESANMMNTIPETQRVLVTAHDAFGYFGRMHGLKVVGLQGLSTEDEIGITDVDDTIGLLMEYKVPAVFVESSVNQNSINAVIQGAGSRGLKVKLGGELFSDAMGDGGTPEGTYIGMYRHNVKTIATALGGGGN
ncbi:manganese transporter [Bacillus sp. FJAT-27264]|uniref:metal ABC transporter solute-binding protein, Zn/Mn family n=1 Tax=Paenibacillus sp. (strain DSM 101736 / FJAT-27264) TaxID=1850362 RepID=UPI000807BD02|nr:zinc ABC transporter substrate-binding protein [Bacillus sp. FJAT-27264]OBZ18845.1 manganese transporter [Bacillus sp. FJAT-27264]